MIHSSNILILTNSIDMGGRETRLLGEMKALKAAFNTEIHIINLFNNKSALATELLSKYSKVTDYNLSSDVQQMSAEFIINTTAKLIKYCRQQDIQAIYIHNSDVESLISVFASQQLCIPIFGTLHGKGMVFSNRLNPVLHFIFFYLTAPALSLLFLMSYSLKDILNKYPIENIITLPNLVDTKYFDTKKEMQLNAEAVFDRWLLVSRLSIEKYQGILKLIEYAYRSGIKGIDIAGDGIYKNYIENELNDCGLEGYVRFLGEQRVTSHILSSYTVVAGVGRVVLEALSNRNLTFLIGTGANEHLSGFVNQNNIIEVAYSNFNGENLESLCFEQFSSSLSEVKDIDLEYLRNYVLKNHSEEMLSDNFIPYLRNVKFEPNPLIRDLYSSLNYFRSSLKTPFYLQPSFFDLLENLVYSNAHSDELEKAFVLMKKRVNSNFVYPIKHHQQKLHLKVNRPVLKGDTLLESTNLNVENSQSFNIKPYNHDINLNEPYIVFLHFYNYQNEKNKPNVKKIIIQFDLYDQLRDSFIICSEDIQFIEFKPDLGFYRVLDLNDDINRNGIKVQLNANIRVDSITVSSFLREEIISFDKIHIWVTY